MERLFALRSKMKAEAAAEAFVVARGQFQKTCPIIEKKKSVTGKDGKLRYKFAPLDSIVEQIRGSLADNGLSYSWDVKHIEGHMEVTCRLTHVLGHSETSTFEIPIDSEGYMTAPQKYASAQTFAKRYTLCNVAGISTGDEDTDATDVGKESNAKSDKAKIMFLLRRLGTDVSTKEIIAANVKKATGIELAEENYQKIVVSLENMVKEEAAV